MKKPLVGICRGLQLVNVAFGGKLTNHLAKHGPNHAGTRHDVQLLDTFPLSAWRGKRLKVNSYHNHGVMPKGLARGLVAMAVSPKRHSN